MPSYRKHHPPRAARLAQLSVSSETVTVARPGSASPSLCPTERLTLNMVRVFEDSPHRVSRRSNGTCGPRSPSIQPSKQLARCLPLPLGDRGVFQGPQDRLRDRATAARDDAWSLVNALALFAPIAWRLLLLRTLARQQPTEPAASILSDSQLQCLRFMLRRRKRPDLPQVPTVADIFLGIAAVGGHLKRNGLPGWAVIGRGYDQILCMQVGYEAAMTERYDQS